VVVVGTAIDSGGGLELPLKFTIQYNTLHAQSQEKEFLGA